MIRLKIGELKEVRIARPKGTNVRVVGTSENHEIVDVSRRQRSEVDLDPMSRRAGPFVFQIKGITPGTARVVFSEKATGPESASQEIPGQSLKVYQVQVVSN